MTMVALSSEPYCSAWNTFPAADSDLLMDGFCSRLVSSTCSEMTSAASVGSWHRLMTSQISWSLSRKLIPSEVRARKESLACWTCGDDVCWFSGNNGTVYKKNSRTAPPWDSQWLVSFRALRWHRLLSGESLLCYASWRAVRLRLPDRRCSTTGSHQTSGSWTQTSNSKTSCLVKVSE